MNLRRAVARDIRLCSGRAFFRAVHGKEPRPQGAGAHAPLNTIGIMGRRRDAKTRLHDTGDATAKPVWGVLRRYSSTGSSQQGRVTPK
jgi:hypothetical protein